MCDFDVGYMSLMLVVWVRMWLCEFNVGYMGRNVAVWVWCSLCGFDGVRGRKEKREDRDGRERGNWFVYIICWYSLYNFNKLYVKIETGM